MAYVVISRPDSTEQSEELGKENYHKSNLNNYHEKLHKCREIMLHCLNKKKLYINYYRDQTTTTMFYQNKLPTNILDIYEIFIHSPLKY